VAAFSLEVQEAAAVSPIAEAVAAAVEATQAVSQEEEATQAVVAPAGIGNVKRRERRDDSVGRSLAFSFAT